MGMHGLCTCCHADRSGPLALGPHNARPLPQPSPSPLHLPQFEAFAKGFLMLCGGPALQLFSATELERLVCGNPTLDFDNLVRNARYEGGYHAEHRVVQWLWQAVADFGADERRLFLKFFTGSDRAPIGGLGNLRCIIQVCSSRRRPGHDAGHARLLKQAARTQPSAPAPPPSPPTPLPHLQRDGPDSTKLPTSHTCFNTLLLPSYRSKEKLADRLRLAILNSEGFGLE
jgi:ubiquitin-protein ligase E3 A